MRVLLYRVLVTACKEKSSFYYLFVPPSFSLAFINRGLERPEFYLHRPARIEYTT